MSNQAAEIATKREGKPQDLALQSLLDMVAETSDGDMPELVEMAYRIGFGNGRADRQAEVRHSLRCLGFSGEALL